ncbi:MFS transporter [Sphingomonas glacialis]|uniref:MFS transporter n=1 Tax=Sphingomonas glacialis TaxID=658225 RepID=A0A502G5I2_9SPHN|nr:MFS transporter [Sphingomonas glacialis]TPG56466.1 MFS transporter [Sphingomonas glacialis]
MTAYPDRIFSAGGAGRSTLLVPVLGALGYAGCVVAYLPLLTLLLPLRIEQIAGEARFGVLATAMIAGAAMASVSGIVFGWLSDLSLERGGGRRAWIAAGLVATIVSYLGIAGARTPEMLVVAVMVFQVSLNIALAPLVALLAEESLDRQKGLLSGLLAGAQPLGAVMGPLLATWTTPALGLRLGVIAIVAIVCLAPLLALSARPAAQAVERRVVVSSRDMAIAWISRLMVQISGNVLFAYLLFFMEQVAAPAARSAVPAQVGGLIFMANLVPLPLALVFGRWSDRSGRRKPFLMAAVALDVVGLVVMACATDLTAAAIGFGLFSIGWTTFLTLQIGFVMQLLPNPRRRGRDLGLINLSNTVPVLIGPALAWWLATPRSFATLFFALAALSLLGGLAMLGVTGRK